MHTQARMGARLYDILFAGPIRFYFAAFVQTPLLQVFATGTALLTILYNLQNYLIIERQDVLHENALFPSHPQHGKLQAHRAFNLLVMYPLELYMAVADTPQLPTPMRLLWIVMIVCGFTYNLHNYVKLMGRTEHL